MARSEAGRKGKEVRSDCWIAVEEKSSGGISIAFKSKVASMYGAALKDMITTGLKFFGIEHAAVEFEDAGALPFTVMARIETAVRRMRPAEKREFLPDMAPRCTYGTHRERMRRSRLYLPGNEAKFMINAGLHKPDGVILDLEDSVHPSEKDSARVHVRNALRQIDFTGSERMVRINQGELGFTDLDFIVPHNVHIILIPKCESAEEVKAIDAHIAEIKKQHKVKADVFLMPIVESALGAIKAYEIAAASPNVVALTIGLEDYTADIGTRRTNEGRESFWARAQVVNAARAAKVQPIDTVFSDVSDMEGLRASVLEAKSLGFEGKGCIHPRQIEVINDAFAPTEDEIKRAKAIVVAYDEAQAKGLGVVSLGSKMIDPPVVKRALRTVDLAVASGKLAENWRETK
ncbi:MAG TPA: aldolase/citrate lyase family protein [bacterium]|nr:aldolase/citrate lyase family protein [bacterium]